MFFSMPTLDILEKMTWKFTPDGNFSLESSTWAKNDNISPHRRAKLLSVVGNLTSACEDLCSEAHQREITYKKYYRKYG